MKSDYGEMVRRLELRYLVSTIEIKRCSRLLKKRSGEPYENLMDIMKMATGLNQGSLLGSIFPENFYTISENGFRTARVNEVVHLIWY